MAGHTVEAEPPVIEAQSASNINGDYTLILKGDPAGFAWALAAFANIRDAIDRLDKIGHGWGVVNRALGWSAFVRRTKHGASVHVRSEATITSADDASGTTP